MKRSCFGCLAILISGIVCALFPAWRELSWRLGLLLLLAIIGAAALFSVTRDDEKPHQEPTYLNGYDRALRGGRKYSREEYEGVFQNIHHYEPAPSYSEYEKEYEKQEEYKRLSDYMSSNSG